MVVLKRAVLAGLLAACLPSFDDDPSRVDAPRVLAVRAIPAEATPGQAVTLSVLVASRAPAPPPAWALCTARRPLTELGPVAQSCIDRFPSGPELLPLGTGFDATATLAADVCQRFGPLTPPADASGIAARPADPDPTGGFHQPVVVGGPAEKALGSIRLACGAVGAPNAEMARLAREYRPNENPVIEALEIDGRPAADVPIRPGARVVLRARWARCPGAPVCGDGLCTSGENGTTCASDCGPSARGCTGAEVYVAIDAATRAVTARRETIQVAWYATDGRFAASQTAANGDAAEGVWTAPTVPGSVRAWAVARDDRGGVGWIEVALRVE